MAKLKVVAPITVEIPDEVFDKIKADYEKDDIEAEHALLKPFYEGISGEDVRSATVEKDGEKLELWTDWAE